MILIIMKSIIEILHLLKAKPHIKNTAKKRNIIITGYFIREVIDLFEK